jgi:hypothetical protein
MGRGGRLTKLDDARDRDDGAGNLISLEHIAEKLWVLDIARRTRVAAVVIRGTVVHLFTVRTTGNRNGNGGGDRDESEEDDVLELHFD